MISVHPPISGIVRKGKTSRRNIPTVSLLRDKLPSLVSEELIRDYETSPDRTPHHAIQGTLRLTIARTDWTTPAANIVGIKQGSGDKLIVIGAHYDHLGSDAQKGVFFPGANDNASGVSMLCALSEYFKDVATNCGIVFAAFGREEGGREGSQYFVDNLPDKGDVKAMINLDMIGRLDDNNTLFYENTGMELPRIECSSPDRGDCLNLRLLIGGRSDHEPFVGASIPALYLPTGTDEGYIHTVRDTAGRINYDGLNRIYTYLKQLILQLDKNTESR